MNKSDELVTKLLSLTDGRSTDFKYRHSFSPNSARIWVRAEFRCEYCGQSMIASAPAFYSFQYDHVLPTSQYRNNQFIDVATSNLFRSRRWSDEELNTFALSCRLCNSIKSDFDANELLQAYPGEGPITSECRAILIERVRETFTPIRREYDEMFAMVQDLMRASGED